MRKIALVTGASSGIGLASAVALSAAGFVVYAGVRSPAATEAVLSRGLCALRLDVRDEAAMQAAIAEIEAEHGGVDVLVNSAGFGLQGPMEEVSLERLRDEFEVNVFGLLRLTQLALPAMRARRSGRVIHIGSIGGVFAAPGAGPYHMSKYALEALSDSMRAEVRGFGIQVALIQPTGVRTPFVYKQVETMPADLPGHPYGAFKTAMVRISVGLFTPDSRVVVNPEDVAEAVLHAATARRARTRYKVGAAAQIIAFLRRSVSDRTWDSLMLSQVKNAAPGRTPRGRSPEPYLGLQSG